MLDFSSRLLILLQYYYLVKHPDSGRHVRDPVEAGEGGEAGEAGQVGGDEGLGPGDVQLGEGEVGGVGG